jgi:hydrogenase maturation factor
MCLAVPGRIVEIPGGGEAAVGPVATADFQASRAEVSPAMAPEASAGRCPAGKPRIKGSLQ